MGFQFVVNTENRGKITPPSTSTKQDFKRARKTARNRARKRRHKEAAKHRPSGYKPPIPTETEQLLAKIFDAHGIRYKQQYEIRRRGAGKKRPIAWLDFYIPIVRAGVEVDGRRHFEPEGRAADGKRTAKILKSGAPVRRIWRVSNTEVLKRGPFLQRILVECEYAWRAATAPLIDALLMDCEAGGDTA